MSALSTLSTRKRALWVILTVSVLINGFFIGMLVMGYFDPPRRGGLRGEVDSVARRLPSDYGERLRNDVRAIVPELKPQWRRLRELHREIGAEAAKPEPDRAAIDARLAEIRAISLDTQARVHGRIYDQVLTYPLEVRQGLQRDDDQRK